MVNTLRIKHARTAYDTMHLVVLLQQKFGEVCAILAGYAGNKSFFHRIFRTTFLSAKGLRCPGQATLSQTL